MADVHFGLAHWCRLLAHHCDNLGGACTCDCHRP
jgi:hypothetical protein